MACGRALCQCTPGPLPLHPQVVEEAVAEQEQHQQRCGTPPGKSEEEDEGPEEEGEGTGDKAEAKAYGVVEGGVLYLNLYRPNLSGFGHFCTICF